MSFYDKYIELCAAANVYPSVAAEEMGFSKSTVSGWKRRKNTPSDLTLQTVASYFNVSKSFFEEGAEPNKKQKAEVSFAHDAADMEQLFTAATDEQKIEWAARLISSLSDNQQAALIQRIMFKK